MRGAGSKLYRRTASRNFLSGCSNLVELDLLTSRACLVYQFLFAEKENLFHVLVRSMLQILLPDYDNDDAHPDALGVCGGSGMFSRAGDTRTKSKYRRQRRLRGKVAIRRSRRSGGSDTKSSA